MNHEHTDTCCHDHGHDHGHCHAPHPVMAAIGIPTGNIGSRWNDPYIEAMDRPTEECLICDALGRQPIVESLELNLMQHLLRVQHYFNSAESLQELAVGLGMQVMSLDADENTGGPPQAPAKPQWSLALAGTMALASEVVERFGLAPDWVVAGLALLVILGADLLIYRKGWVALENRNLNTNALVNITVIGAALTSQWPEVATISMLFATAKLIEVKFLDRVRNAIRGLLQLTSEQATVLVGGEWKELPTKQMELEAIVCMEPDGRVAPDGEMTGSRSGVNRVPITGESLPTEKEVGEPAFAGSISGEDALEYCITCHVDGSTLARITHVVEEAQGSRMPTQRSVDSFARVYTSVVLLIALATAVLPPLLFDDAWPDRIYRTLVLLMTAYPYALVIPTSMIIVSGLSAVVHLGILIKGGAPLKLGCRLSWVALDKTGAVTHGKPQQTDYLPVTETDRTSACLLATSLAARFDHPISRAVVNAVEESGFALGVAEDLAALPGRGVSRHIGGVPHHLGNHRLVEELDPYSPALEKHLDALGRQGKTVITLCDPQRAQALFVVTDRVKDNNYEVTRKPYALDAKTLILTGNNLHTATAIVTQVGIDAACDNLLPEDKLCEAEMYQADGPRVGMVGGGINDAPVLARVDIGSAMGVAGADVAIETIDVTLVGGGSRKLSQLARLSHTTHATLVQNITLALGIKAVLPALTLTGEGTLWMAVLIDMDASPLMAFNGL